MLASAKANISRRLSDQNPNIRQSIQENVDNLVVNAQQEKQARQAKHQEAQIQAIKLCEDIKNQLELVILQPNWLTDMEDRLDNGDKDIMLHELNEDIQFNQDNIHFFKPGSSFVDDDNGHSFNQIFFDDNWDKSSIKPRNSKELIRYSKPKKQTFKQKNQAIIRELKLNIERLKFEEINSPLRRSKTISQQLRNSKDRSSRAVESQHAKDKQIQQLQEELNERQKIQTRIIHEEQKLKEYSILRDIIQNIDVVIKFYNSTMARDGILSIEHIELNDNKVKKKHEQENLRRELQTLRQAQKVNQELRIDHLSYQEREFLNSSEQTLTNTDEKAKFQERQLLRKALSKYDQVGGIMKLIQRNEETADDYRQRQVWMAKAIFINEKTEDAQIRKEKLKLVKSYGEREMQLDQYLLQQEQIKDYNIEQMFQGHRQFKALINDVRAIHDRIRLQCKESTNSFTFRIYSIFDIAKIKCPNQDLMTIIQRHKKYWPYKSLQYSRVDKENSISNAGSQEDNTLSGLLQMESKKRLTIAQKRKLDAAKKKLMQQRQKEFEAPEELDNKEIIGNVLKQLIETKLNFVHQKFILSYLIVQIRNLKIELNLQLPDQDSNYSEIFSQASYSQFQFNVGFQGVN